MTRRERQLRFQIEIYKAASFFKMQTTGSASMDAQVNKMAQPAFPPIPNPTITKKPRVARENWRRRRIIRGNSM